MGDTFKDIKNSTIINRSSVEKSFNKVKESFDEDTAQAILKVAKAVESSGNKDAGELFNSFNDEIAKPEPKKPVIKSLWQGLTTMLPTILTLTGVVEKITKLF